MKSSNLFSVKNHLLEMQSNVFSQELLREALIPDLLGEDHEEIMYYAGKRLARQFPIELKENLITFFEEAGWGQLELIKDKKSTSTYSLSGPIIETRLSYKKNPSFNLEAGFLAEQCQQQTHSFTEASYTLKQRSNTVIFTVHSE